MGICPGVPTSDFYGYWGVALCECVESVQTAIVVEVGAELAAAALDLDVVGWRGCCGFVGRGCGREEEAAIIRRDVGCLAEEESGSK